MKTIRGVGKESVVEDDRTRMIQLRNRLWENHDCSSCRCSKEEERIVSISVWPMFYDAGVFTKTSQQVLGSKKRTVKERSNSREIGKEGKLSKRCRSRVEIVLSSSCTRMYNVQVYGCND